MATANSAAGAGRRNAYDAVAAEQTDSVLVAANAGKQIRVIALVANQGDTTASAVTLNSKGSGAGVAIFPALKGAANGLVVLPECRSGWVETNPGEALTVTTGAGSATGIVVVYEVVSV